MSNVLRLTCLNGNLKGHHWDVVTYARVGRGDNLELTLPDSSVSRMHAVIDNELGWRATDLRSTNGTFLNGIRLGKARGGGTRPDSILLQDRDILQFGKVAMIVVVRDEAEVPDPERPQFGARVDGADPDSSTRQFSPTAFGASKPTTPEEAWYGAHVRHPGLVVLIRVGGNYETFHDDAEKVAAACRLSLLDRKGKRCRFSADALDECLDKLMDRNLRMVVCDRSTEIRVGVPQECLAPAIHEC